MTLYYQPVHQLLLSNVKKSKEGRLVCGFVENGSWYARITDVEFQCCDGYDHIVTRLNRVNDDDLIYCVPKEVEGDYNEVIQYMENSLGAPK